MWKRWLTIKETCERYPIKSTSLYERLNAGEIIAVRLGKRTIVDAESVERFISSLPPYRPENEK